MPLNVLREAIYAYADLILIAIKLVLEQESVRKSALRLVTVTPYKTVHMLAVSILVTTAADALSVPYEPTGHVRGNVPR
jgi:hypothetical protein